MNNDYKGYAYFFMVIAGTIVPLLLALVFYFIIGYSQPIWIKWIVNIISYYLFAFPCYIILSKYTDGVFLKNQTHNKLSFKSIINIACLCFFVYFIFMYIKNIILDNRTISSNNINTLFITNIDQEIYLILNFLCTCIIAPLYEELVFRKVMLYKFYKFDNSISMIVSSFAFALFHFDLWDFVPLFIIGLLLSWVVLKTNTIKYTVIIHMLLNLSIFLITYQFIPSIFLGLYVIGIFIIAIRYLIFLKKINIHKSFRINHIELKSILTKWNFIAICISIFMSIYNEVTL